MEDEFETKSEIKKVIDEFKSSQIGVANYKIFVEKLLSNERIIMSVIATSIEEYVKTKDKLKEFKETPEYKTAIENGFVPKRGMELAEDMNRILKNSYSWRLMEATMYSILFDKIIEILKDIDEIGIRKGVLEETREMDKTRNETLLEVVKNIMNVNSDAMVSMNDKFMASISLVVKQQNYERKNMLVKFSEIMIDNNSRETGKKFVDGVKEKDFKDGEEEIKTINKLIVKKQKSEKKASKSVKKDKDPFDEESDEDIKYKEDDIDDEMEID